MLKTVPLSSINNKSRDLSMVMCYEGTWSDACYRTWGDFLDGTARLRRHIEAEKSASWLLHCEDRWFFLLAFTALLQCRKEILLSANVSPAYTAEIRGNAAFLTDQVICADCPGKTYHIPTLLEQNTKTDICPAINKDETSIIIFTSGSTGKPIAIRQRLTELENDNSFILSKWGNEFLSRKLCSTVNQHHIYGLLFSILLPFTAGIPFKREIIEVPEELEKLCDTQYMIITVPAFLKRAVEIDSPAGFRLKSPWIFVSGGVLSRETAEKTSTVFGCWPLEVYGSTETSGIAWRQSDKGSEWTAFDNALLGCNDEGCLLIRSPYIKDPGGFQTADLVEILEDGRFLLKGRIDSVVKIEEKRISLLEIETRLLQSGLVLEACVIALEHKRQYLAAALVFNDRGKERFKGLEKNEVNKYWREYLLQYFENLLIPKKWRYLQALPSDAQGKRKKEDIMLLFTENNQGDVNAGFGKFNGVRLMEKTESSAALEFSIPGASPYYDGHFPDFPLLPAVAQAELAVRFADEHLGTGIDISEIRRIKFLNPIVPDSPIVLRLEQKENILSFKIISPDGATNYSSGTLTMRTGDACKTDKERQAGL